MLAWFICKTIEDFSITFAYIPVTPYTTKITATKKKPKQSHLLLLYSLLRFSSHIACILMNQLTHEILLYLLWAPTISRVYMRHKTHVDVSRRLCERARPKARRVVVSVACDERSLSSQILNQYIFLSVIFVYTLKHYRRVSRWR